MAKTYDALSGEQIKQKIKKKHVFRCICGTLGLIAVPLVMYAVIRFGIMQEHEYFTSIIILAVLLVGFSVLGKTLQKSRQTIADIDNIRLFRKYGSAETIAARIAQGCESPLMNTGRSFVGSTFIMQHDNFESYIPFEEILLLYRKVHRTNGVTDGVYLEVHDTYGDHFQYPFRIGKKHEAEMEKVVNKILEQAPNCRVGYTKENLEYAKAAAKELS
ncbi:MAG: hypothetical protein MJ071_08810 [Oscillospiraceae bacterium]|nr:hypothetical protein [Oscillospiraceae bacterium]